ncbi:unnamed protein product, partial [Didymodactylos carnosus]
MTSTRPRVSTSSKTAVAHPPPLALTASSAEALAP